MKFVECYETIEDYYSKTKVFNVNVDYILYYKSLKGIFQPEITDILKTISGECFYTIEDINTST
jgi:hypothetical protein|nr:MAG TPA: hypothetical protein [Caudoviricetes sp.]